MFVQIYSRFEGSKGGLFVAQPVDYILELDEGKMPEPMLNIRSEEAQALMDSLWDAGLRPTAGSGSAGAMDATLRHLEDMRYLVFKGERK